ncbi:cell division protein ftsX-like protein [Firmicutes bacterium CAG:884]|nr:cell division protein ftsX-like protein [Firmicutes bacterium CAG:884]
MQYVRIFGRSIRDAIKGVFRNLSLSMASILCTTITLIVVAISIVLTYNINNFTKLIESDMSIVVFLKKDISKEEVTTVENKIKEVDNVVSCTYKSKADILKEMMETDSSLSSILSQYNDENNPLLSTFIVKVEDLKHIDDVAKKIEIYDEVEYVKYGENAISELINIFDIIRKGSIMIVVALVLVTAFLISNTIKIAIIARRKEIEIMRLVGASNLNIKIPFIFEGLIIGIIGSIIPILVTSYGYSAIYNNFNGQLFSPILKLIRPVPFVYYVSLALLIVGALVGMIGSYRASRKYLKI